MTRKPRRPSWDADTVKTLRRTLGLSQEEMARRLGVRQQTVSEWETGMYAPRGASAMMLGVLAERTEHPYGARAGKDKNTGLEQSDDTA